VSATGAQALVAGLEAEGVEVVFGLPGVHNLAAWAALRESPIRLIGVRHEQAAVYAADGYARATGRAGVALVTTGPGAANTLGATGEAWASGSPVVVIATDIPSTLRRDGVHRGVLHECVDQPGMFRPVTKAQHHGVDAAGAVRAALEHPQRPVYLEVPTDALSWPAPADAPAALSGRAPADAATAPAQRSWPAPDAAHAAALLRAARRPLVWAGGGAVRDGAAGAVGALAHGLGAPLLTTYAGRGIPGDLGLPPHVPEAGALWDEADVVIAVGSDLDGVQTQNWRQPQPPRLIVVNVDPADATKNYRADAVVAARAGGGCHALANALDSGVREPWADTGAIRERAFARLRSEHPAELEFLDAFAAALPEDAVVVADMCIPGYWLMALHRVPAPRKLQTPLGWGTLGYAFPAALGAACAGAGPVVAVCGDGGLLFACGELATMAQERLPLTVLIVDDGGYGMLRYDQQRAGAEPYGVDLHTPDFVALAEAFGVRAEAVDGLGEELSAALARHVADAAPSVLVARAALEPAPTTSPRWYRPVG